MDRETSHRQSPRPIRTFRDLIVWQRSMELAQAVYRHTGALPETERFGLTSQMRRAACSVPSNIAEGYGRGTTPDYLRHCRIARGSMAELQTQIELAVGLGFLQIPDSALELLSETDRLLQGLIRSLRAKIEETRPPPS